MSITHIGAANEAALRESVDGLDLSVWREGEMDGGGARETGESFQKDLRAGRLHEPLEGDGGIAAPTDAQRVAVDGKRPGTGQNLLDLLGAAHGDDGDGPGPQAATRHAREQCLVRDAVVHSVHVDLAEGHV